MTTEHLISVEYTDGRVEGYRCEYTNGPMDGVLHLGNIENTGATMTLVLANVRNYTDRRLQ